MQDESTIELVKPQGEHDSLLPCPFCGGKEILYEKYARAAGVRWRVWCSGCVAGIDPGYAQQAHTVRRMWNRRVSNDS